MVLTAQSAEAFGRQTLQKHLIKHFFLNGNILLDGSSGLNETKISKRKKEEEEEKKPNGVTS